MCDCEFQGSQSYVAGMLITVVRHNVPDVAKVRSASRFRAK